MSRKDFMPLLTQYCTRRSFLAGSVTLFGSTLLSSSWGQEVAPATTTAKPPQSDLDFGSAVEAARAIRRGEVSSIELTTRMLERIKQYNPQINAIVTLTEPEALAQARAADEALKRGEWWGPFHGVPCTVKDTLETAGVRTTAGAPSLAKHIPTRDAVAVAVACSWRGNLGKDQPAAHGQGLAELQRRLRDDQ